MANALNTFIDLECTKCNSKYQITLDKYKRRSRNNTPNLCTNCMKEYIREKQKNYFSSLSEEEKKIFIDKRNWYNRASDEKKIEHAQKTKDQLSKRTKEEWDSINKKNSEGLKKHWKSITSDDKYKRVQSMIEANKKRWENMTDEERSKKAKQRLAEMDPEMLNAYISVLSNRMKKYNQSLSIEEKQNRAAHMNQVNKNKSAEERAEIYRKSHEWYHDLNNQGKIKYAEDKANWYNNLDNDDKIFHSKKSLSIGNISSLHRKFESYFTNSHLINDFYFKGEISLMSEFVHKWDYGIYNKSNNELMMVVDIDGKKYHADSEDYNGMHSKEEYDERRSLTIPDGVKHFIIQEANFNKCFEFMVKTLMMNYDEYVEYMFKSFRSMPFPYPSYSDKELIESYNKLCDMKCNDKYHKNISLNTRVGDRLIQHFHLSIYTAHRKGAISPYEAWYNDDLLKECIQNRIIYQNYLNPNKILQGFNISKIATKVSVFSAGRAKLIINKYLSDCNEIFDPFSGFSGRMLGTVSLGKRYIGQDISMIHVNESNRMIKFLKDFYYEFNIKINANIKHNDLLQSSGEYECLFTCPPYEDIEQWLEVPVDTRTCDDWIDECLNRFKCKKYLFVVDYTEKYKEYIVDEIKNKSHLNKNSEYVILIER